LCAAIASRASSGRNVFAIRRDESPSIAQCGRQPPLPWKQAVRRTKSASTSRWGSKELVRSVFCQRRKPSSPPSRYALAYRLTVDKLTPMLVVTFSRVSPWCSSHRVSIFCRVGLWVIVAPLAPCVALPPIDARGTTSSLSSVRPRPQASPALPAARRSRCTKRRPAGQEQFITSRARYRVAYQVSTFALRASLC
jgi:hypothetical protein